MEVMIEETKKIVQNYLDSNKANNYIRRKIMGLIDNLQSYYMWLDRTEEELLEEINDDKDEGLRLSALRREGILEGLREAKYMFHFYTNEEENNDED